MVAAIVADFRSAPISEAERVLLAFAEKLTQQPWASSERDIQVLREFGWADEAILDVTLVVSYFAFVNRIASGLGVELEEK